MLFELQTSPVTECGHGLDSHISECLGSRSPHLLDHPNYFFPVYKYAIISRYEDLAAAPDQ